MRSLLIAVSLAALTVPALSQGFPQALPPDMPMGGAAPRPLPPLPVQQPGPQGQAEASVGSPAPMPAQPDGGYRLPASGMPTGQNLSGAGNYAGSLQAGASQRLNEFTQGVNAPTAKLDAAPIANQSDLESITAGQRNIVVLKQKVEEAKLAVELWHVLYNNDDAKALREKEEKVAESKAKEDKERESKAQAQAATVNAGAAMASAMRSVDPVPPKVVEVTGGKALLLVHGLGEVWVRAGDSVNGGWKVNSVAPKAVRVTGPKGKLVLGYGDTIQPPMPAMGMQPMQPPQPPRPMAAPRI